MAFKFTIVGNALIVTDTILAKIVLEEPTKDVYFNSDFLRDSVKISIYDTNGTTKQSGAQLFSEALADCIDPLDIIFTDATFRTFARTNFVDSGAGGGATQPAEVTAFVTTALLADAATFTATVIDVDGFSQVQTEILASHDGTIDISFCADSGCTDVVRSLSIPYTASGGYQFFAAPAFGNFIKYEFTNNGGVTQTDFYYTTKILTTSISPQLLTTGAFIAPSMVTTLGRNIIVGQDENGAFGNVSVTETINDAGTYKNLNVVSGARPSELAGRVKVSEVCDTAVSVLQRTITASKTFFVTDIFLTIDNTDNSATGRVNLRDGLTVAGAIILPIQIQEAATNESATETVTHTFSEPIEFSTGLFIEEGAGINTVTGVIIGYEE